MSRTLTAGFQTALAESTLKLAVLVTFDFSSGATYYWSGTGNLSWDTHTWLGVGMLGSMTSLEEASGTQAPGVEFEISGVDPSITAIALDDTHQGRSCKAWLALFDTGDVLIADPALIFNGVMDTMTIKKSGEMASISIACEGRNIAISRNRELRYTDQEQRRLFPGDTGCQNVAALQNKMLHWGEKGQPVSAPPRDRDAGWGGGTFPDQAHLP